MLLELFMTSICSGAHATEGHQTCDSPAVMSKHALGGLGEGTEGQRAMRMKENLQHGVGGYLQDQIVLG